MLMSCPRDSIPAETKRAVLVEAGHRCAIPTCRATTTEIAHIDPWAETQDNSFRNLIALCPTCHTRYDQKKEIDRKSMRMYKENLAILNNRYGEVERRIFSMLARTGERVFMLGPAGDVMVANAVSDGLFADANVKHGTFDITGRGPAGEFKKSFPMTFTFSVTDQGVDFISRYAKGEAIT
jgi:hypothetical protein